MNDKTDKNDIEVMNEINGKGDGVNNPHNSIFEKTFSNVENVRTFLKKELPASVHRHLDFRKIVIEPTGYISARLRPFRSDIVIQVGLKGKSKKQEYVRIYILFEHKSSPEKDVLVQVLNYMVLEWQKDIEAKKQLKVIIPFIFYHGRKKWNIPSSFLGQFDVHNDLKEFMMDYRYIFFNTGDHDFNTGENRDLKENVFLFTSLMLMKNAFNNNMDVVDEIIKFWGEKGIADTDKLIMISLTYISEIRDIPLERLKAILEESKLGGGDIMPSLAQRLRDEGKEIWKKEGKQEARQETKQEIAIAMLNDGDSIKKIIRCTGLTEKEVKDLMN
ncbi:MAG: Rpn family recombination-promoting nuclease/putative transposase [bacterium]|nr:Rpn family recombination-promoting nuclease/putative transposase [bacterium]